MSLHTADLSKTIRDKRTPDPLLSTKIPSIQSVLKDVYVEQKFLPRFIDDDDQDIPQLTVEDSYVNLVIVKHNEQLGKEDKLRYVHSKGDAGDTLLNDYEDIHTAKEPIKLEKIFDVPDSNKECRKILIYGRAGIGKTTLIHKIAHMWAKNHLWSNNFSHAFWISLRRLNRYTSTDIIVDNLKLISEVIYDCCLSETELEPNQLEHLKTILAPPSNCKILFLLDGYDEVTSDPKYNFIAKKFLDSVLRNRKFYIIMTSRPNAVESTLQSRFDRQLENIGLDPNDVQVYIDKYFDKSELLDCKVSILQFIKEKKVIQGLVRIPINLFLLCYNWNILRNTIDNTCLLSDLYEQTVSLLLKRYLNKTLGSNTTNMTSRETEIRCHEEYMLLGRIAFTGMQAGQIIITKDIIVELEAKTEVLENVVKKTGLLKGIGDKGSKIIDKDHYFIHLTFQEYFAARHIVTLLESSNQDILQYAIRFIEKYKYCRIHERTISFIAGIIGRRSKDVRYRFWDLILNRTIDLGLIKQATLIIRCIQESSTDDIPCRDLIIQYLAEIIPFYLYSDWMIQVLSECPKIIKMTGAIGLYLTSLRAKDKLTRANAAQALGSLGHFSQEVINGLLSILQDLDWSVKYNAIKALEGSTDPGHQVIHGLTVGLRDPDPEIRRSSATALARFGKLTQNVISEFISSLRDPEYLFKSEMIKVFCKSAQLSGHDILLDLLQDPDLEIRKDAVNALSQLDYVSLDSKIVSVLVTLLTDPDPFITSFTVDALGKLEHLEPEDISKIVTLLKDPRSSIRHNAVDALGKLGHSNPAAIMGLVASLQDLDPEIKETATLHLGELNDPRPAVICGLVTVLQNADPWLRRIVVETLSMLRDLNSEGIWELVSSLRNPNELIRENIAEILGCIGDSSPLILDGLMTTLKDPIPIVRWMAAESLHKLGVPFGVINSLGSSDCRIRWKAAEALGNLESMALQIIPEAVAALENQDISIRWCATNVLNLLKHSSTEIISKLVIALKDPNEEIRYWAIDSLAMLGDSNQEAITELVKILGGNSNKFIKIQCVNALIGIGARNPEVLSRLISLLNSEDRSDIIDVAQILSEIEDSISKAVPGLVTSLQNPQVISRLRSLLNSEDSAITVLVIEILSKIADFSVETLVGLVTMLQNADLQIRMQALKAVSKSKNSDPKVIMALVSLLKEPQSGIGIRFDVSRTLCKLGHFFPEAMSELMPVIVKYFPVSRAFKGIKALRTLVEIQPGSISPILQYLKSHNQLSKAILLLKDLPISTLYQTLIDSNDKSLVDLIPVILHESVIAITISTNSIVLHANIPIELKIAEDRIQTVFNVFSKYSNERELPTLFLDPINEYKQPFPIPGIKSMSKITFSAIILCAKYDEALAFRQVLKHQSATEDEKFHNSLLYHLLTTKDRNDRCFEIQVYCPRNQAGAVMTSTDAISILNRHTPDWVFMTGICAGNPNKTVLGDVIIAERVVDARYGKIDHTGTHHDIRPLTIDAYLNTAIMETRNALRGSWDQYIPTPRPVTRRYQEELVLELLDKNHQTGMYIPDIMLNIPKMFKSKEECHVVLNGLTSANPPQITRSSNGKYVLNSAQYEELTILIRDTTFPKPDNKEPEVYCGTLLTDVSAVRADLDEKKWTQYGEEVGARDLYGLEMEGIGLYEAIETINRDRDPRIKFMLVKGVSDYAGERKDDQFHEYGKQTSAVFVYEFLRRYGYKLIDGDKDKISTDTDSKEN